MRVPVMSLVDRIDDALPQTQCTRCGFADCRGYARALAESAVGVGINQCPPGGAEGIARLARITGRPSVTLNPANGVEGPLRLAVIDEQWCIGCTLCIDACPVGCIVGAAKQMHTVIASQCTGCELCIPVCPVDCIALDNVSGERRGWDAWSEQQAVDARMRYAARQQRTGAESIGSAEQAATSEGSPFAEARVPAAAALPAAVRTHNTTAANPVDPAPPDAGPGLAHSPDLEATPDAAGLARRSIIEAALARARARNAGR